MEMTVSQMTVSDLRQLISDVFEEKFSEISDPDNGLELREDLRARLLDQTQRVAQGERGRPMADVFAEMGLD